MHVQQPEASHTSSADDRASVVVPPGVGGAQASLARRSDRGDGGSGDSLLGLFESFLSSAALLFSLYFLAETFDNGLSPAYVLLGLITFALAYPSKPRLQMNLLPLMLDIVLNWLWVVGLLLLCALFTRYDRMYNSTVLWHGIGFHPEVLPTRNHVSLDLKVSRPSFLNT